MDLGIVKLLKFACGGLILGYWPSCLKMMITPKVVKRDSKIIISLR